MEPQLIADYACETGEGPLWHHLEQRLYWADIPSGRLFRYDPATGDHEQFYDGDVVGGFTIQADGSLVLFMERGAIRLCRDGRLTTLIDSVPGEEENRFNDVIADPAGRVFCGTMSCDPDLAMRQPLGHLYRLDTDGTLTAVLDGVGVSNGLGFTPDRQQMYYTDTAKYAIAQFAYDQPTGAISNQRVFARVARTADEGAPDGMTVDAEGYVWSARWGGGCLVRYTPDGREDRRIQVPAQHVTSVIFGGSDYTDMYITTAGGHDKQENGPSAGALFRVNVGIRGVPEFPSRIRL